MEKKISINERFNSANSLRAVFVTSRRKKNVFFFIAHEKIYGLVFQSHEIACCPVFSFLFVSFISSLARHKPKKILSQITCDKLTAILSKH